jgi:hypothetical protein
MPEPIVTAAAIAAASAAADQVVATTEKTLTLLERIFPAWLGKRRDDAELAIWENRLKIAQKVIDKMDQMGIKEANRTIPISFLKPLWESASLEENDLLQEKWASLLANAANGTSGVETRTSYLSTLQQLSPSDASLMDAIYNSKEIGEIIDVDELQLPRDFPNVAIQVEIDAIDIEYSVANLIRLGCLAVAPSHGPNTTIDNVYRTHYGLHFMRACSID